MRWGTSETGTNETVNMIHGHLAILSCLLIWSGRLYCNLGPLLYGLHGPCHCLNLICDIILLFDVCHLPQRFGLVQYITTNLL